MLEAGDPILAWKTEHAHCTLDAKFTVLKMELEFVPWILTEHRTRRLDSAIPENELATDNEAWTLHLNWQLSRNMNPPGIWK